ncbi:hypothetical protein DOY81_001154, partial [Sarcophaga bullata]
MRFYPLRAYDLYVSTNEMRLFLLSQLKLSNSYKLLLSSPLPTFS